jgi:ligand-binding sensor domain-containing protein/signal transduction histidine kinase
LRGKASSWEVFERNISLRRPRHILSLLLISLSGWCAVPEARVVSRTAKLPVVDATDIRFAGISTSEGLSQTRVTNIVQDDLGFLWFGTQYGLNRFDGYNFKVFVHEQGNPNSLGGVKVTALLKDRDGTLWIGCEQYLDRMDPKQGTFRHYSIPAVKYMSQDRNGLLWLSTSSGLYRLDPGTEDVRAYTHDPKNPHGFHTNEIRSAGEDESGRFWIADADGLHEFDRESGRLKLQIPIRNAGRDFSFYEDRLGVFWLFHGSGDGLASFDRKSNVLTNYAFERPSLASTALSGITAILEDRHGDLWLASQGLGLLKFDREHKQIISFRYSDHYADSLLEDRVNTLFEDKEGNIWVALFGKGLQRFKPKPPAFQPLGFRLPGLKPNEGIGSIYEDHRGDLWIGARSALYRVDRKGQVTVFSPVKHGTAFDVVNIIEDRSGHIWVGTFNNGLFRLDPRTHAWKNYRHDESDTSSLSNNIAFRLLVDHRGTLWIATWDGLNRFDAATERFTTFRADPKNRELQYYAISEGPDNNLWLGTDTSGLQRFDPRTGQFKTYARSADAPGELSDNGVNSIHVTRAGVMWLSTQNGLNRFDPQSGEVTVFTSRDGLAGNSLSCVLEDDGGQLWMATNKGVSSFDPIQKTFRNFTTADGLPGPELGGWGACERTARGQMMFAGFSGTTIFRPEEVTADAYVPPIVLTEFKLFGSRQGNAQSPLRAPISYASKIVLSHDQNLFSLTFAALSYSDPRTSRYRYMLEGLDSSWNEVESDRRSVTYTSLPAGQYRFRVQGATSHSSWSEPGAEIEITILPPWWSTWWFRTLYMFLVVLLIWAAYRYRMRQVARQFEVRLEERVIERTRIARELHDTLLQSFQGLLLRFQAAFELLPKRPIEAKEALATALRRADSALVEGRDAVQELRSHADADRDFVRIIGEIANGLKECGSNGEISLHTVVEGAPRPLQPIVQEEVRSIVREALRNAFLHSHAHNVEAEIAYSAKKFRVRVRDDGRGVNPEILAEGGRAGHWGLAGMRERADQLGAKFELWSEVDAGTEIQLSVPGSIAYAKPSSRSQALVFQRNKRKAG